MIIEIIIIGLVAFYLLARAGKRAKLLGIVDSVYEATRKYGDVIHIAYGAFTAKIIEYGIKQGTLGVALVVSAAALIMFLAYVAYQYAQRDENVPKDIATYVAAFAVTLGAILGIPLKIPYISSA